MNKEELIAYIQSTYGVAPDIPFEKSQHKIFRHFHNKKWFAALMSVSQEKLKREGNDTVDILNLKSDPLLIGSLRVKKGVLPAYHMNKEHWVTIVLNEFSSKEELFDLIDLSHSLTK